jgi:hypothetical protein
VDTSSVAVANARGVSPRHAGSSLPPRFTAATALGLTAPLLSSTALPGRYGRGQRRGHATVEGVNHVASNGVIHQVDTVLIPAP